MVGNTSMRRRKLGLENDGYFFPLGRNSPSQRGDKEVARFYQGGTEGAFSLDEGRHLKERRKVTKRQKEFWQQHGLAGFRSTHLQRPNAIRIWWLSLNHPTSLRSQLWERKPKSDCLNPRSSQG